MSLKDKFERLVSEIESGSVEAHRLVSHSIVPSVISSDLKMGEDGLHPDLVDKLVIGNLTHRDSVFPQYGGIVVARNRISTRLEGNEAKLHHELFGHPLICMYHDARCGQGPLSLDEIAQVIRKVDNPCTRGCIDRGNTAYNILSFAGLIRARKPLTLGDDNSDPIYFNLLREDLEIALKKIRAYIN